MLIKRNVSLKSFNTFGIECMAGTLIHVRTEKEARSLLSGGLTCKKPLLIIGSGSNILFTRDFRGTIICPMFRSIRIENLENEGVIISAGAGVVWDDLVEWSVQMGLGGIENLSGIPGKVGAVPVQNIGAYGTEAKDVIAKVRTLRTSDGKIRIFRNEECGFGYRSSIFKKDEKGKYLVTRVYFRLNLNHVPNLGYGTLKEEVKKLGRPTLKNMRTAVLSIRQSKLPDPAIIGNAGSFFKNPLVSKRRAESLISRYPQMPVYDDPSGMKKIAAGWLIEQCGWKGKRAGEAGVHEKQALVLVNHGTAAGREIFELSEKIRRSVEDKFGIRLEREVEVI